MRHRSARSASAGAAAALRFGAASRSEADGHARSALPLRPRRRAADRRRPAHRRGAGLRLPRADRGARAGGRRLAISRPARRRWPPPGARRGAAERPAARRPDRGQGPDRHRRHADRLRLGDLRGPSSGGGRRLRRAGARRRRDRPRQDRHHRIRLLHPGQDRQPAQPGAYPRRLVERLGRRGRRRHGAARLRQPDRRLGDPARPRIAASSATSRATA